MLYITDTYLNDDIEKTEETPNLIPFYINYCKATLKMFGVNPSHLVGGMPNLVKLLQKEAVKGNSYAHNLLEDLEEVGITHHGKVTII